jgi:molybdate transport system substrate-binding protein
VERGEAEAGIVYATDAGAASGLRIVYEFDPGLHDEIVYVLVLLKHGGDKPQAAKLYEYLQSSEAEEVYTKLGFTRISPATL